VDGVQLLDVVWTGSRFVTVGTGLDDLGAILDSADGLSWHLRAPVPGMFADHLAVGPLGLVATGMVDDLDAWTSPDGLTWTVRKSAFAVSGAGSDDIAVSDVVATDHGWLAVGREDVQCTIDCGNEPVRALVWTSDDGSSWQRVPNQASFGRAAMTGVTRGGPGYVAVGLATGRGVVWTSTDGEAWSRVADEPVFHAPSGFAQTTGAQMTGVAAAGGTIVAVGDVFTQDVGGTALAWWSTDGRLWSRGKGQRFLGGQLFSVAAVPGGFLAVGPSGAPSCVSGMWSSPDGRAWLCISGNPGLVGFGPYAAAASPDLVVVVGLQDTGEDTAPIGAIWVSRAG
jgi:hypothetical protein